MIVGDPGRLRRRAISLGADPQDADDIAQTVLLRAWRSIDTLRSYDGGPLCAWLDVIARNTVLDARRPRLFAVGQPLEDVAFTATDAVETNVDTRLVMERVIAEIRSLPEIFLVPFVLTVVESRSATEVAAVLGITPAAVRQRVSRARKSVAAAIPAAFD
ncbi:sigma-70 family RNA polymerase sigma factor [Microbacterium sp. BG28]|uniref:RNA polymerase sigma factor n=1 Tax=Microbacterium sp. BG28 TaxID=3097356 RepID=UPI002A59BC6A|nr:sigma-70 family RNA polymerase sigma factor [Microbacterium sp. BG28]MDY0830163.1 sigma-70 family RNA polymerase sigma factor [Microbacterium sp. BG28]